MALDYPKRFLFSLLCVFSIVGASAQRNVFHFKAAPTLAQSAEYEFVYSIPLDSVRNIVYEGRAIDPNVPWLQKPAQIIPSGGLDSLIKSGALTWGYYLAVSAVQNQMRIRIFRHSGFNVLIHDMDDIKILEVEDKERKERRAHVTLGQKILSYDSGMHGYVIPAYAQEEELSVQRGADILFYKCRIQANSSYSNPEWTNEATEIAKIQGRFNGYLVTNKPVYLPHDTVKWKAYLEDPTNGNRPVREQIRINFAEQYGYQTKNFEIAAGLKAEAPGVYFGAFVLGDSVKMDRVYDLNIVGMKSGFSINTRFKTQDYLLDDTHLRVTGESFSIYQPGDSVNLYAHAYNSNNLPVMDGQLSITVLRQGDYRAVDTLYHSEVPLSPDGETNIGFSTSSFPPVTRGVICKVSLVNANNEHADTTFNINYTTTSDPYIRVKQSGRKLHAELIQNKKSVSGKGRVTVHDPAGSTIKGLDIIYPYDYVVSDHDYYLSFHRNNDSGVSVIKLNHTVQEAVITGVEDFHGDTAVLELSNPSNLFYRYSIFLGEEFRGYGFARGDTVIEVESKNGQTVSIMGFYEWKGQTRRRNFAIYKLDRELDIDLRKKDLVYPGQRDTISVRLSDKDGKGISRTNVTVLAFNSRFVEDYTATLPYGGLMFPSYVSKYRRWLEQMEKKQPATVMATKSWLSRCAADTMFFYKNLFLLPDDVAWVTYDIPASETPQVGVYLQKGGNYFTPQVIYVDDHPVYVKQANGVNHEGFFVSKGPHTLRIRTSDAEYQLPYFEVCGGVKTDLYLRLDSVGPFFRTDTVGDTIKTYRIENHLRSLLSKSEKSNSYSFDERNNLVSYLLLYRPEGSYVNNEESYTELGDPGFYQWPIQIRASRGNGGVSYSRPRFLLNSYVQLIGPFNPSDPVGFFQSGNCKRVFELDRDYEYMFRPQIIRIEKSKTEAFLYGSLSDSRIWPTMNFVAPNPQDFDTLKLKTPQTDKVTGKSENKKDKSAYSSGIKGVLVDAKGEPVMNANVVVKLGGEVEGRAVTGIDGEYIISKLTRGNYQVHFTYQGIVRIYTSVDVPIGQMVTVNGKMSATPGVNGITVTTSRYVVPIINPESPGGRSIKTADQIEKTPSRNAADVAELSTQVYQGGSGTGLSIGGGRSANSKYVVGGVQLKPDEGYIASEKKALNGAILDRNSDASKAFFSNFMANMAGASGMRQSFRDWAIWEPNLWTGNDGVATFHVTYPDNLTSWKTYVLAMNKDGFAGRTLRITRAFKPLSASLMMPRFLRYGDTAIGIGKVANYMEEPFKLRSTFTLQGNTMASDTMNVHNAHVQMLSVTAPTANVIDTAQLPVSYSIKAENGYMDGETRTIPVMPVGVIESRGDFLTMIEDTTVFSSVDSNAGHFTGRVRVNVDGSMYEVMLREIENLKEFPHGCNEQMTTKLLAIYYEEAIKKFLGRTDFNNTETKKQILEKLIQAQRPDGGFGWWSTNSADYRITNYIISTMQRMDDDGWLSYIIRRGQTYLNNQLPSMQRIDDQLSTLSTLSDGKFQYNFKPILARLDSQKYLSVYDSFLLVKIRKSQGLPYRTRLDSLMSRRVETRAGISWQNQSYDWYRDDLATTLLAYSIIKEDSVYRKLIPDITRYLLSKRDRGYYRSTAASGLVLTTVLPDMLKRSGAASAKTPTYVRLSGSINDSVTSFPKTFTVRNSNPSFRITKKGMSPAYVSVVYDYFNTNPKPRDSDFAVRSYFLQAKSGDTLSELKAGEKVTLRTTVTCKKEGEYIMIEVPIPAGCVQVEKDGPSYRYREAARENFKDQTVIFCNQLGPGTYTFDVALEARFKGSYQVSPARAGLMYYPEAFGNNTVQRVNIR